ncbi:DUF2788 domain-containing protein [Brevibacillus sp. IT-7CA2]|uniref:hypothetical protein n=1 Tax=Bacillales TaxID=1385 RepID=UPI00036C0BD1|nr:MULTISPECIES: hypothetical protein [Bacillales]KMZ42883.1 hypothetical protein AC624_18105 [Bacillus sp. FJAT-27238]
MSETVFSFIELLEIAGGIFFFSLFRYGLSKHNATWKFIILEYFAIVMSIWIIKSLVNLIFG